MRWWGLLFLPFARAMTSSLETTPSLKLIKGISLGSGLETNNRNVDCFWEHDASYYVPLLHDIGFNSLRIPFSAQYVREGDFEVLDEIMDLARENQMTVLLDLHRVWNSHQGDVSEISKEELIEVWTTILERYKYKEHLTSVGIWNEYQKEDTTFWNGFLKDVIQTLEEKFPNRFIYYASGVRWAGSLRGMDLEDLPFKDRIRYEWHKYVFSSSYDWRNDWDWSIESGIPKDRIVVGEWGFKNEEHDIQWANAFVDYLIEKDVRITDEVFLTISRNFTGVSLHLTLPTHLPVFFICTQCLFIENKWNFICMADRFLYFSPFYVPFLFNSIFYCLACL